MRATEHMDDAKPTFEVRRAGGSLQVVGDVDLATADQFRTALRAEVDGAGGAIVDLSECSFLGSEGIGVLVEASQHTSEGRIVLRGVTGQIRRLLDVAGLDRLPGIDIERDS